MLGQHVGIGDIVTRAPALLVRLRVVHFGHDVIERPLAARVDEDGSESLVTRRIGDPLTPAAATPAAAPPASASAKPERVATYTRSSPVE